MATSRRLATNLFTGVFNNIFRIAIQIVMLPLMARLLGPAEMSLYTLAMPMLSFVVLLADGGLGDSLAQEKTDDTLIWSSAFWGLFISGAVLSLLLFGASFFVAALADQPRLPMVMLPLSSTLFLVCVTVIPGALLFREGNLTPGAIGEFIATLAGAAVGLVMAFLHFGVWAMVCQFVTTAALRTAILNYIRPFVPKLQFSLKALVGHTHVGGAILGGRLMELSGRTLEGSGVSRILGEAALGSYGYANQIGRFFSDAISNPIWANLYYVSINKSENEVAEQYVRSHRIFSLMIAAPEVLLTLALPTLVPMLLGPAWVPSTYPIMLMVLSSPFASIANCCSAVLFARRQVKLMWITTGIYSGARVLLTLAAFKLGVTGLTVGLSVINIVYYFYVVLFVSPVIGAKAIDLLKGVVGPVLAAAATGVCFYFVHGHHPGLLWLIVSGGLSFLVYPVALFLFDNRAIRVDLALMAETWGLARRAT